VEEEEEEENVIDAWLIVGGELKPRGDLSFKREPWGEPCGER